ncbi:MAG TPA: AAA family ATPase [Terriglobia bacterium]|nr:AAA family ATPase [Terriglobia bacterium]
MKIENLRIDGFGVWCDKTWEALSPGLNVFHGPNETGKSTLMAFIRSILFGLDRRGQARRYEPLNGGTHGGWLDVTVQGRPVRIERKAGKHVRGVVSLYDGDATGGDVELERLLGGTTRTLYHNVFAFGLEELEQFHTLQDTEISPHISGAALGIGAARWTAVQKDIEARQRSLFLPHGQNGVINVALKELESVREDLDRTEHQPEEYWAAQEARTRLAAEVAGLEDVVADLKARVAHYEKRLKSRPMLERRRAIEAKLRSMPAVETFPEGGLERLELLRKQFRTLQSDRDGLRRQIEQRRLDRRDLQLVADPEETGRKVQVLESLRKLVPRMETARRVYESSIEQRRAVSQERTAVETAMQSTRPPSAVAFYSFLALLAIAAFVVIASGYPYVASGVFAVMLLPMLWYRKRLRVFEGLVKQSKSCNERMQGCITEVQRIEVEARSIETDLRKLTGKTDISQEDIDERAVEIEARSKVAEDLRRLDESIERGRGDVDRLSVQLAEVQDAIDVLFTEAAAADEKEFVERAEIFKQRQLLISELERLPIEPPEPGLLFDVRANEEEAYETIQQELLEAERRLVESRHESGRVAERITVMERSEERSRALARQEVVLARIDASAEVWAVVTLCKTLLDETRKVYENDRQPEVLRHASRFFRTMSAERYSRVVAPLDGTELQVERRDGVRLLPQLLSRGTAEQLYLAMRFALLRDYAGHSDPLPVVFDDVFVNFDPERTRNTFQAVGELTETHQVLLFTCHPHVVALAHEIVPTAKVFSLE